MDGFAALFRGVRAQGALFGSSGLRAPWSLRFVDGAPLTFCALLQGSGWIVTEVGHRERLEAGDLLLVKGPATFDFVDDPATDATPVLSGVACAVPELGGARYRSGWHDPVAPASQEDARFVVGAYPVRGLLGQRLLDLLPSVLRVDAGGAAGSVRDLLAEEVAIDAPGQQVVLDRLLDWMLVCSIREWLGRPDTEAPAWYASHHDRIVGGALRRMHAEPTAPWTVTSLAAAVGASKATFSKRFAEAVGESPARYLAAWRMTLAADLLVESPGASIASIASDVGYADAFGLSAAFKRHWGSAPSAYRRTMLAR